MTLEPSLQARKQAGKGDAKALGDQFQVQNGYIPPAAFDIGQETPVNPYLLRHFDLSPTALIAQFANALPSRTSPVNRIEELLPWNVVSGAEAIAC